MTRNKTSRAWGIASLTTAIISLLLFLMPYFGLPLAIFSLVAYGMQKSKDGFATAGLIVGILGLLINLVTVLFIIVMFSIMGV
jgi:hypothetical protein